MTPRDTKSVPKVSRKLTTTVRNIVGNNPQFIALSMDKITVPPLGIVTSSKKGLKINIILNTENMITRISSKNLISCRKKLPTKSPSIKILTKIFPTRRLPKRIMSF